MANLIVQTSGYVNLSNHLESGTSVGQDRLANALLVSDSQGNDVLIGSSGLNRFELSSGGDDVVITRGGRDDVDARYTDYEHPATSRINTGSGDDSISFLLGGHTINGGTGDDSIWGWDNAVDPHANTLIGGEGNDHIDLDGDGFARVFGGNGDDELYGERGTTIYGGSGNDEINTQDGLIYGGNGDDWIHAFISPLISSGSGNDTIDVSAEMSLVITDFEDGVDKFALLQQLTYEDIQSHARNSEHGLLVNFGEGHGYLILKGMTLAHLDASDFI